MMIKKIPATINTFTLCETLLKKGFSFIAKEGAGNYEVYDVEGCFWKARRLPQVTGDEEMIQLQAEVYDAMDVSYRKVSNSLIEVFDPDFEEYQDVDLPLYRASSYATSFSYMGTTFILKQVPTANMVKKAYEYKERVDQEIKRLALLGEITNGIDYSHDGVSTIIETDYQVTYDYLDESKFYMMYIKMPYRSYQRYKILVVSKEAAHENATDGVLEIAVPSEYAGIVIGKEGRCTKAMAQELGLRYVKVNAY